MSNIVAGHFQLQNEVAQVRDALAHAGFPEDRISAFFLNQPGQHDMTPIGGDRIESPGTKETPTGLVEGAATGGAVGVVVGAVTSPVTGPVGPVVGGLVGAHVGSLFGLSKMKEAGEPEEGGTGENLFEQRPSGLLVAVALEAPADEARAIAVMRSAGAHYIERAKGSIENGDWTDFDPLSVPVMVH